jgi:hypothetical protein
LFSTTPYRTPSPSPAILGQPLNQTTEESPVQDPSSTHPYFTPASQALLQKARAQALAISSKLRELQHLDNEHIGQLITRANALHTETPDKFHTIAVLGDSGHGKSTLINSLLDAVGLCETGAEGRAVTSVVTEFHWKQEINPQPFSIEVEYLTQAGIEELVAELVWDYRQPLMVSDGEDISQDRELAQRRRVALSALEAAFRHHNDLRAVCDQGCEVPNDAVTAKLVEWTRELQWPTSGVEGRWLADAMSVEECNDLTEIFTKDSFWPFVKVIRIHMQAEVLRNGIVLVDLPGEFVFCF